MTVEDLAARWGCEPPTVLQMVRLRGVPYFQVGSRKRLDNAAEGSPIPTGRDRAMGRGPGVGLGREEGHPLGQAERKPECHALRPRMGRG